MKQDSFAIPTNDFPIGWHVQQMPTKPGEPATWAATYKTVTQTGFPTAEKAYKFLCNQMAQVIAAQEDVIADLSGEVPFDPDDPSGAAFAVVLDRFYDDKKRKEATNGNAD